MVRQAATSVAAEGKRTVFCILQAMKNPTGLNWLPATCLKGLNYRIEESWLTFAF